MRQQISFTAGSRFIEYTKSFLSRYLVYCSENKYETMRYLMSRVCFLQKYMRVSFIEEILEGANQILVSQRQLDNVMG